MLGLSDVGILASNSAWVGGVPQSGRGSAAVAAVSVSIAIAAKAKNAGPYPHEHSVFPRMAYPPKAPRSGSYRLSLMLTS
jgi:hypothetical protein